MAGLEIDELTREFVAETREMLENVGTSLLVWEDNPADRATLDAVFRLVHTVKGSCGFVDQPRIGALAHAAEEGLAAARDGKRTADRALVGAMLGLVDRISQLIDAIEGGDAPDIATDAALVDAIDRAEAAPAPFEVAPATAPASTIRMPVALLEMIMGQVSDLVLARNDLARRLRADEEASAALGPLTNMLGELRDSIGRARLQPIERLFRGLPRLVRDTAAALGKDVVLTIEGDDVEIDREMVEALKDPLTHIVRNAIDHGIEKDRATVGKPARAYLRVTARQSGNQVTIAINDDGRGLDLSRLIEKANAVGVAIPAGDPGLLIFEPGLSTAVEVTGVSGRGVGMDVVRANIERIGGGVMLDNRPGQGLGVIIRVPLTLSILSCLIVQAGEQRFAIPRAAIEEVVAIGSNAVRYEAIGDSHIASLRGELLSVAHLPALLRLPSGTPGRLIVVSIAGARFVLPVDRTLEHEELVVRPLAPAVANALFAGQSLSDEGHPILLLDAMGIAAAANIARREQSEAAPAVPVTLVRQSALVFVGTDGRQCAVRAMDIARIEEVERSAFVEVGSETFVTMDGQLLPAVFEGALPVGDNIVTLRVRNGNTMVAWPVDRVCDLVPLGDITAVAALNFAGLIMVEGQAVPLMHAVPNTPEAQRLVA